MDNSTEKNSVRDFWDRTSCGEVYAKGSSAEAQYEAQAKTRYELEPYIQDFAHFAEGSGKDILEIGVGMGADHLEWAKTQPKSLTGIDLTPSAVHHTKNRLSIYCLESKVEVADAENLPYDNDSFDVVYSWGVLHHSPDTPKAVNEVFRVLRRGGVARIMIYNKYSIVGYLLWLRYGLLLGKPFRSLDDIYGHHLESPGTKAYTIEQTKGMFTNFSEVKIKPQLSFGDLLKGEVGQRHRGILLNLAKKLWPRWLIKRFFANHGLYLLITARK